MSMTERVQSSECWYQELHIDMAQNIITTYTKSLRGKQAGHDIDNETPPQSWGQQTRTLVKIPRSYPSFSVGILCSRGLELSQVYLNMGNNKLLRDRTFEPREAFLERQDYLEN